MQEDPQSAISSSPVAIHQMQEHDAFAHTWTIHRDLYALSTVRWIWNCDWQTCIRYARSFALGLIRLMRGRLAPYALFSVNTSGLLSPLLVVHARHSFWVSAWQILNLQISVTQAPLPYIHWNWMAERPSPRVDCRNVVCCNARLSPSSRALISVYCTGSQRTREFSCSLQLSLCLLRAINKSMMLCWCI